jgi:hypothetical protein
MAQLRQFGSHYSIDQKSSPNRHISSKLSCDTELYELFTNLGYARQGPSSEPEATTGPSPKLGPHAGEQILSNVFLSVSRQRLFSGKKNPFPISTDPPTETTSVDNTKIHPKTCARHNEANKR